MLSTPGKPLHPAPPGPGRRQRLARRAHALGLLPLLRGVRGWLRHDLRVLAYHRVREVDAGFAFDPMLVSATPAQFADQMRHLRDRYRPVGVEQVIDAVDQGRPLPRDAVLVTFDDGYDDNYSIAFPILRDLGIPATFFVATGHIDTGRAYGFDWLVHMLLVADADSVQVPELGFDRPLPPDRALRAAAAEALLDRLKSLDDAGQQAVIARLERDWGLPRTSGHVDCQPMTWAQLRQMQAAGMTIGAHGVDHRMLAKLPAQDMLDEVAAATARLDAELGPGPRVLSYPVGGPDAYNDEVIGAVRAAGYRLAFTYLSGCNRWPLREPHALRRLAMERPLDQAWFQAILALPEVFNHPSVVRVYPA